jgi:hypothetical protein
LVRGVVDRRRREPDEERFAPYAGDAALLRARDDADVDLDAGGGLLDPQT